MAGIRKPLQNQTGALQQSAAASWRLVELTAPTVNAARSAADSDTRGRFAGQGPVLLRYVERLPKTAGAV
jgi:hypothetical protein